jgi:UDP-N-acetylmuramate dehydrogenase
MEIANFRGELKEHEPLSRHTSYVIGGPADVFAAPVDRDDLLLLLREIGRQGLPYVVLGGGTNLLVRDKGFRGVAVSLRRLRTIRVERGYRSIGGAFAVVFAEAGAALAKLLVFAADQGLTGLEFAAGIPGTVGGAIRMNAGTAAGEFGDIVDTVTLLTPQGAAITRGREELGFGYRTSTIPDGHFIVDARIILRRDEPGAVKGRIRELLKKRKQRQPAGQPNAGSVFKNPAEEAAGKLIETAGLKGTTVGGAMVSDVHANFIVNTGSATASDVLALMEIVKEKVLEVHGVRLEPEIKIIGED